MAGYGGSPDRLGTPGSIVPPQSPDAFRKAVRGEVRRLSSSVGDQQDIATYAGLEEQAEQFPPGSRERRNIERRMRRLGPPTETQIFLKRLLAFGSMGALAVIALLTGEQTILHATATHGALLDVQNTLNHLNIFNIGGDMQHVISGLQTAETNAVQTAVSGAETAATTVAEVAVVSQKPWKRPRRRGWLF